MIRKISRNNLSNLCWDTNRIINWLAKQDAVSCETETLSKLYQLIRDTDLSIQENYNEVEALIRKARTE